MKKLMIAVAAVACAVAVQAAAVSWNSGTMYAASKADGTPGTTTAYKSGMTGHAMTAYLFTFADQSAYEAATKLTTEQVYKQYIVGGVTPAADPKKAAAGTANIKQSNLPDGSGTSPQTVWGMVVYVDTDSAASFDAVDAFVKVGYNTGTYQDTTGLTFGNMGTQQTKWTAVSSVPEPTSGLLLLLGVAGLALRRRRA